MSLINYHADAGFLIVTTDLKPRIKGWTPHQTLGDIFVKVVS